MAAETCACLLSASVCWKADIWSLLVKHQWHAETMTLASTSHPGLDFVTQEDIWPYRESVLAVTSWRHVAPGIWWVEDKDDIKHPPVHSEAPHQKKKMVSDSRCQLCPSSAPPECLPLFPGTNK